MSAFILPVGFAHFTLSIRHAQVPRPMLVTWSAEVETPPFTQANLNSLYTDVSGALDGLYDAEYTWPQLVALVGQDGDPARFVSTGAGVGGRATSQSPTPQVTYLVQKNTGLSGRRNRGRMYLPAANEANIEQGGQLNGTEFALLNTTANELLTACESAGGNNLDGMVLLHSQAPSTPTPVISVEPSLFVATQRRRLVRSA